jgi:hypothetical protein
VPSYTTYGLRLDSDVEIAGLPAAPALAGPKGIQVHFGSLPPALDEGEASDWYESPERDAAGEPNLRIQRIAATGDLCVRYSDGTQFLIDASANVVHAAWPDELTLEDTVIYLLGPVLGILLRARGRTCLHASVVAVGGRALAFLGPAGAGKSTIAAAFAQAGHAVLSDDLLVLGERGGRFWAEPGYSRLRLWPDSVEGLYGVPDALPLLVEGWEKRYLDLEAEGTFCAEALPLAAIHTIARREQDLPRAAIEPLSHRAALLRLIADVYTGHFPGRAQRRRDFEVLSRLASEVPVRQVSLGSNWASLADLPAAVTAGSGEQPRARAV